MFFKLAASTKEKRTEIIIKCSRFDQLTKLILCFHLQSKKKPFSLHGISKKRKQILSIHNMLVSSNEYIIFNSLHHLVLNSIVVVEDPDFLHTRNPTVHTRSHQGAGPCTADIVDKVIYTGESLSNRDKGDPTKRERLGCCLYLSVLLDSSFM